MEPVVLSSGDEITKEQIDEIFSGGAVGIDLGTTYSAVATINEAGRPEVLTNFEGALTTPSIVLFDESGETIVGERARDLGQGQASNVVECVKRAMLTPQMEYNIKGKKFTPVGISSIILSKLIKDASERLGKDRPVKSAVITTPAWFNNEARAATREAGEKAGLVVLGILSEPTAAAIAYSLQGLPIAGKTLLVYDLGGGTFDVSIMKVEEDGTINEIARDGDVKLGGKDWDKEIVIRVAEAFQKENGQEIPEESNEYFTLGVEAEKAKKVLTDLEKTSIFLRFEGKSITFKFTREEFESWTENHLSRTKDMVNNVLLNNNLTADQIDLVLPVGASSKMPQVRQLLDQMFPGKSDHRVEKDLIVAIGACWYMAKKILELKDALNKIPNPPPIPPDPEDPTKTGKIKPGLAIPNTIERSSRTYGIKALLDDKVTFYNHQFVKANELLPIDTNSTFCTVAPNQPEILIELIEGDSKNVEECKLLATQSCTLPAGLKEGHELDVNFAFTKEGTIRVTLLSPTRSGKPERLEYKIALMSAEEEKNLGIARQYLQ